MSETVLILVLGVIAVGAVAYPLLVGYARYGDPADLEADIEAYREALSADTVCPRCRYPNAPDARYCSECGTALDGDE